MVFFFEKAEALLRETTLREGMSVCEDGVMGNTLQNDGMSIVECITILNSSE